MPWTVCLLLGVNLLPGLSAVTAAADAATNDRPNVILIVPHVMPHVPIFASDEFRGRSAHGLYGDVVEELDWSVGQILSSAGLDPTNCR